LEEPELVQAMWNEDERNAGMEQGSGDMDRKTVCILDVALQTVESILNSMRAPVTLII